MLVVRPSDIGREVFSDAAFERGDVLRELVGQKFALKDLPFPYTEDHYMQIGVDLYISPSDGVGVYINHSCDPNAGIQIVRGRVFLVAIKPISVGEKIRYDYSTTMDEEGWVMECWCSTTICRKRISAFRNVPQSVRERYLRLNIVPGYVVRSFTGVI